MELGATQSVVLPYYTTIKVHRLMCLELKKLIDSISHIFSAIESARPRCTSGMQALCSLQSAMDKANLLIQHCSESSKLYLAITAKAILLRCEKIRKTLEICMNQVQELVPLLLGSKISGIIDELRSASFPLEPAEYEAGAVILALLEHDMSASASKVQSEIESLRLAALRLSIASPFAILIEKRSIKKLLGKVQDTNRNKGKILNYLLYLLEKHGNLIWQLQSKNIEEESLFSLMKQQEEEDDDETSGNDLFIPIPPEEVICPISMRLLYDPVIIASGKTFERVWIKKWFNEGNQTCPVINTKLKELCLTPNLAMKALISKWLLRHGINVPQHAKPVPSLLSLRKPSSSSIASFGSSVLGMQLELGSGTLDMVGTESRYHHSSKTSSNGGSGVHEACLSELYQYSWNSQCKAVENVKGLLENNDNALHLTFSNSHVTPVIKFLKDANEICDIKMQKNGAEVLLAILSSSRVELPPCHEDVIYLLASLMHSETTGESLAILEILSWQQHYMSRILASGLLPSILKLLDSTVKQFYMLALKILRNLSNDSDIGYHITYLGYIPKLVSFLEDLDVSGYCVEIINNICNIEEARIEAVEAGLCVSIAMILESGNKREQELAVELTMFLCYENKGYCQMIMTENVLQYLANISVNGNSKASENALILIDFFGFMMKSEASRSSNPGSSFSQGYSNVSSVTSNESRLKRSTYKALGCLRKKLRFLFRPILTSFFAPGLRQHFASSSETNVLQFQKYQTLIGKTLEKTYVPEDQLLKQIQESPIPINIILSISHSAFVNGDGTNFEIKPSFGFEASELYPEVKYTTVEESLSRFV